MTASNDVDRAAHSDALENLARVGLIAFGVVHLLVAWLALQLAWFGGGESADQSGAMGTLADSPFGKPLLWVLAVGLFALAVWQAAEVLRWRTGWSASGKARTKALQKSARRCQGRRLRRARRARDPVRHRQRAVQLAAAAADDGRRLRLARRAVARGLAGAGAHRRRRLPRAQGHEQALPQADRHLGGLAEALRLVTRLGQIGFPGKGIALAGVGGLLVWAAVTFDPSKASGLDGAMRTILDARSARSCSPWSRSASPRSGSSASSGPATPSAPRRGPDSPSLPTSGGRDGLPRNSSGAGAAGDVDDLTGDEAGALADQERHGVRDVLRLAGAGHRDRRGARAATYAPSPARSAPRSPWSCR